MRRPGSDTCGFSPMSGATEWGSWDFAGAGGWHSSQQHRHATSRLAVVYYGASPSPLDLVKDIQGAGVG